MKALFLGDIYGKIGTDAVIKELPSLREKLNLDVVVVNGENSAHGFGITPNICNDLFDAGVDCITTGNHAWDKREIIPYIEKNEKIVRPLNYPEGTSGKGYYIFEVNGQKIMIINLMALLFMKQLDEPFNAINKLLSKYKLGRDVDAILLDFHGEATSEKVAMGHYCDGRVSVVVGTHTHIPTADTQILPAGTGYQTDAGMCGTYDSVIGVEKSLVIKRFLKQDLKSRITPSETGEATICGIYFETDKAGLCIDIQPLRIGGKLQQTFPVV